MIGYKVRLDNVMLKLNQVLFCGYSDANLTSHVNFDGLQGVVSEGGIDSDGNCGSPLSTASVGAHTQNI